MPMSGFRPKRWPRIIQLPSFSRAWDGLGLRTVDLIALERTILADPGAAPVIRGAGGLRKIRLALPGRGKSGSIRVAYFNYPAYDIIVLAVLWAKNEKANLSAAECQAMARVSAAFEDGLKKGKM
jgi:hypothetical protein